jgi:hypothetical protein
VNVASAAGAKSLLITADGGGSNGSRVWLWKIELQKLADELGVPIGGARSISAACTGQRSRLLLCSLLFHSAKLVE